MEIAKARSLEDQRREIIVITDDEEEGRDSDVEVLESGKGKGKKRKRYVSDDDEEEDVKDVLRVSLPIFLLQHEISSETDHFDVRVVASRNDPLPQTDSQPLPPRTRTRSKQQTGRSLRSRRSWMLRRGCRREGRNENDQGGGRRRSSFVVGLFVRFHLLFCVCAFA